MRAHQADIACLARLGFGPRSIADLAHRSLTRDIACRWSVFEAQRPGTIWQRGSEWHSMSYLMSLRERVSACSPRNQPTPAGRGCPGGRGKDSASWTWLRRWGGDWRCRLTGPQGHVTAFDPSGDRLELARKVLRLPQSPPPGSLAARHRAAARLLRLSGSVRLRIPPSAARALGECCGWLPRGRVAVAGSMATDWACGRGRRLGLDRFQRALRCPPISSWGASYSVPFAP